MNTESEESPVFATTKKCKLHDGEDDDASVGGHGGRQKMQQLGGDTSDEEKPERAPKDPDKLKLAQCKVRYPVDFKLMIGFNELLLDLMRRVVDGFNSLASAEPAGYHPEMGILATAAMLEEYCRSHANVLY